VGELDQLTRYYLLLERWNRTMNLTSLPLDNCPDRTLDRLIIEPLLSASQLDDTPLHWFDFGSGGGSPAVPLKVMRPNARLTMVEAKGRKGAFLREVVGSLALSSTDVLSSRIEALVGTGLRGMADLVTVRAVRIDQRLLDSSAAVLRLGGRLIVYRSSIPLYYNDLRFESVAELALPAVGSGLSVLERAH
jgi:16S rRNA (guanine527-N7)-methyltransferase